MSAWVYQGKQIDSVDDLPEGKWMGFIYLITNLETGKKYIGKKLFSFSKTKQVKLKVKKIRVESDWLTYYGSNEDLKEEVATKGGDGYSREILHLCVSKGMCNYLETREIFDRRALERDDYYNGWVSVKVSRSHLKF